MHEVPRPQTAATDVAEFVGDLDGGQFEVMLSVAVSKVAAAVIDHSRKGKVKITLDFEQIKKTHSVVVAHEIVYESPTRLGGSRETVKGESVLHVGKYGRLQLTQPSLPDGHEQSSIPGV